MTENTNEKLEQELAKLLQEIQNWKRETVQYRTWNIILFSGFKVLIPLGSLIVAASAFSQLQGQILFSPLTTLILAGLVVVLSGLDSIANPGARKRVGFKKNNSLRELESRVNIKALQLSDEELMEFIIEANTELMEILDDYAEKGY